MNKKEIKQKVMEMLNAGLPKSEVFKTLADGSSKDKQVAFFIASHPDPHLFDQHDGKVNFLITIMFIQAFLGGLGGFFIGVKFGHAGAWITAGVCALIPLLFAYGFFRNLAGAYNAYLILTVVSLPSSIKGLAQTPITTGIGLAINIAILVYVWHIRSLLFPDFQTFFGPKKIKGNYVFSS